MEERKEYLSENGKSKTAALFPNLNRKDGEFYSPNAFNEIKTEVEKASGVDFKLKDFRSTLTSMTVNGDMSLLPAMSAQLRHRNLATTQRSYYRMEEGVAGKRLKNAWKDRPVHNAQTPVIEKEFDNTGYS